MKFTYTKIAALALLAIPAFSVAQFYQIDDGTSENSIGLTAGGDLIWMNQFNVGAGGEVITSIEAAFGNFGSNDTPNGAPVTALMYSDPDGDGIPGDGALLSNTAGVTASTHTDTFVVFDIPDVTLSVGDSFFVGILMNQAAGQFPAAIDQTASVGPRSWVNGNTAGNWDINNMNSGDIGGWLETDAIGFAGNWMVRANATAVPEPATMIALGLGAAAMLRRRRK